MNIKKNYIFNTVSQILSILVSTFTIPYISRILGVENIGIYSYANSIVTYFIMFVVLGLTNYGNREVAKVREDRNCLDEVFSSIYYMQLFFGVLVILLYFIYILIFVKENHLVFYVMTIYILSGIFDISWAINGLELFKESSIRSIIFNTISLVSIFCLVKGADDLIVYVLILSITALGSQIINWIILFKNISLKKVKISEIRKHIIPNIVLFIPVIAVSLYKIMDKIMIGNMAGMKQVGFYENSEKIIKIPTVLISSLGTVMLPRMSNLFSSGKGEQGLQFIDKSILAAMFISCSLCFGIMGVSKEFVPLFYGKGYNTCIGLYMILLPSCIFLAFSNIIRTQFLIPNNREKIYIMAVILGAVANLIINSILIPKMESYGAALGTLIAEATVCIFQACKVRKELPISNYLKHTIPFAASGIIMFALLTNITFQFNCFISLIIKVIIGILVYIIIIIPLSRLFGVNLKRFSKS